MFREIANNGKLDLHIHSNASDGNWTPEELIEEAIKKDLQIISVTDHDTIANVSKAKFLAKKKGLFCVEGVEISSTIQGDLFHVLGYGFSLENSQLNNLLQHNIMLEASNNKLRDETCINTLMEQGHRIDWCEYNDFENGPEPIPGKQFRSKAIDFLIHVGLCKDRNDFFERLYSGGTPIGYPKFPHPKEAIQAIKEAGGIPVLAHPVHRSNKRSLINTLELFNDMGIEGIECIYPGINENDRAFCVKWAHKYNLITTGGSDCHGSRIKGRALGTPMITASMLDLQNFR